MSLWIRKGIVCALAVLAVAILAVPQELAAQENVEKAPKPKKEKTAAKPKVRKSKTAKPRKAKAERSSSSSAVASEAELPSALPPPELTLGTRIGSGEAEGFGDILAPVHLTRSGLLFINPRASFSDNDEEEINFGLGYRHFLPERNMILGANVYYDYRETQLGSQFDQFGIGLEFLSEWIDARVNYYRPEDDREVVGEFETVTETERTRVIDGWQDPFAVGNTIYQQAVFERRTTKTTLRRHFIQYEAAMEGFDMEVGVKLPIPVIDDYADVKVFGGYYNYNAEFGLDDIRGFKGRLEIRALPALYIDAEVFEDKELTASDYYLGARVRLPFDIANISRGRSPFRGALAGLKPRRGEESFASRMTEMVMRDLHVRTELSEVQELEEKRVITTEKRTKTIKPTETAVVATDVTFVDGDNTSGVEDGTVENPWRTVNAGVSNALNQIIFVWDAGQAYGENVILTSGVTLWGSGQPMPVNGGRFFGNGTYPTIDGVQPGPTILLEGDNVTVRGMRITHSGVGEGLVMDPVWEYDVTRVGVYGANVNNTVIRGNRIENTTYGVLLTADGLSDFAATLMDNTIQNNVDGAVIDICEGGKKAIDESTFRFTSMGNTYSRNSGDGLIIYADEFLDSQLSLDGDTAEFNGDDGFDILLHAYRLTEASLANLTARENLDDGIDAFIESEGGATLAVFNSIDASQNAEKGMVIEVTGEVAASVYSDITANDNGEIGIANYTVADSVAASAFAPSQGMIDLLNLGDVISGGLVTADRNGESGIFSLVTGQNVALGLYFDVRARDNSDAGLAAVAQSPNGVAANLIASSDMVTGLAGGVLDFINAMTGMEPPLPVPAPAGIGSVDLSGNGAGLMSVAVSDQVSISAIMDVEANRNESFGINSQSMSQNGSAITLLMSADANENGLGILANTLSQDISVSAMLDVRANNNASMGIVSTTDSEFGSAISLIGSTDPIRGLLGAADTILPDLISLPLPKADAVSPASITFPFPMSGPSEASGNGGPGITSLVSADDVAVSLFLDLRANDNAGPGIMSQLDSEGEAFALYASTDPLMSLLNLPDYEPLGMMEVNNNLGQGIVASLNAEGPAVAGFLGVQANGNNADGILLDSCSDLASAAGSFALIEASGNAGSGISANLQGEYLSLAMLDVTANDNVLDGVRANLEATYEEANAFFLAVTANGNAQSGMNVEMTAECDVEAYFAGITANDNAGNGIDFRGVSRTDDTIAHFLGDTHAVVELEFGDVPDILMSFVPETEVLETARNGQSGLNVELTADDDVILLMVDAAASSNEASGITASLASLTASVSVGGGALSVIGNDLNGIELEANADLDLNLDFGTDAPQGQSSIFGNGQYNFVNASSGDVYAQGNWWGTTDGAAIADGLNNTGGGSIIVDPWLPAAP